MKADTVLQWVLWDFRVTAKFESHLEPPVTNLLLCDDRFCNALFQHVKQERRQSVLRERAVGLRDGW